VYFDYTQEQKALRSAIRRYLLEFHPATSARLDMESELGYDPVGWVNLASGIGLQGLHIPTEFGGAGGSYVELCLAFNELGRVLYAGPFLSTVALASNVLLLSSDEAARSEFLPQIADGSIVATLGVTEDTEDGQPDPARLVVSEVDGGYQLDGHLEYVLDGLGAGLVIVAAAIGGELSFFAIREGAAGLTRTPLKTMDETRRFARLDFAGSPASLIGERGEAARVLPSVLDLARTALAAEQAGGAEACLTMAVAYAKIRVQFGRTIGSFQAIKHKCATLLVEVESSRASAEYAAWSCTQSAAETPLAVSIAKSYCSDAFFHAAAENIQIHGGIGFTWEHDAHLYLKRAKSSQLLFGSPSYHRERLAKLIPLDTAHG
jgi:alkylation response protein AidB-like acyl-CoA dehydrogenase